MKKTDLANIFKVIGEENRLLILCLLFEEKEMCVGEIASKLKLGIAITSHHLKTLEKNNILKSRKEGKEVCYSLHNEDIIKDTKKLICKYIR